MSPPISRSVASALLAAVLASGLVPRADATQVELTFQGGLRLTGAGEPGHALESGTARPGGGRGLTGEATSAGARLGVALSERWGLDAGLTWSRGTARDGAVGQPTPPLETRTLFASSTVQARLTDPGARLLLTGGVGPALILERGDGTTATRSTNVGGLATITGTLRLDTRISLRLDAQQYFFSDPIGAGYTPHLGTTPLRASGARLRHDFVLLAGVSWRTD
jgi:hypothetical protein